MDQSKKKVQKVLATNSSDIYFGGTHLSTFKTLIQKVLNKGKLLPKYIDILTSDENMKKYNTAFTSASASKDNYEFYEQLGDVSAGQFIIWYAYRRMPFLKCDEGVNIVSRIKIKYVSKEYFFNIANNLGFWDYITASIEDRGRNRESLLEDVLEAFLGVTIMILDDTFRQGVGYAIVYDILKSIYDEIDISLEYDELFDIVTNVKESTDFFFRDEKIVYTYNKDANTTKITAIAWLVPKTSSETVPGKDWKQLGVGEPVFNQRKAMKSAAKNAMRYLRSIGKAKPHAEYYDKFSQMKHVF
jgi:dsRNA-specific ribonuclease